MSVRARQRLPMNGDVVQRIEGARLRTLRSEFNSLHPFHLSEGSATPSASLGVLRPREKFAHYGAHFSLTQWAGGVTDEHGAVRRRRSEFNSRPACHFLLLTVLKNNVRVEIEFSNDT